MNGVINRIAYNFKRQECRVEIIEDKTLVRYTYLEPVTGRNSEKIGRSCTFELNEHGDVHEVSIPAREQA